MPGPKNGEQANTFPPFVSVPWIVGPPSVFPDDLAAGAAAQGVPYSGRDRVLDEGDPPVAEQGVDSAGMPAAGRDVVREPVPPVIGVVAVGQPAAAIDAPVVRRPRVI